MIWEMQERVLSEWVSGWVSEWSMSEWMRVSRPKKFSKYKERGLWNIFTWNVLSRRQTWHMTKWPRMAENDIDHLKRYLIRSIFCEWTVIPNVWVCMSNDEEMAGGVIRQGIHVWGGNNSSDGMYQIRWISNYTDLRELLHVVPLDKIHQMHRHTLVTELILQ